MYEKKNVIQNKITKQEIIDYLLDELKEEKRKMLEGKDNHYGYIFMICNDLGFTREEH